MLRELRLLLQGVHDKLDQLLSQPKVSNEVTLADSEIQRFTEAVKPLLGVADADVQRIVNATVEALGGSPDGSSAPTQPSAPSDSQKASDGTDGASQDGSGIQTSNDVNNAPSA